MKKFLSILLFVIFTSSFILPNISFAAWTKNDAAGFYLEDFATAGGMPTANRSYVYVNTSAGVLQLTNTSNQSSFVAPYATSGYARTQQIIPSSLSTLNNITFDANIPTNTTLIVQLCDLAGVVIPDSVLAGNVVGFSSSPIDLSNVPPYYNGTSNEQGRYSIKITMTTTDTNVTPTLDNLKLSWNTRQGDFSPTTFSNTDWRFGATDQQNSLHKNISNPEGYSTFKWVKEDLGDWTQPAASFIYNNNLFVNDWTYHGTGSTTSKYLRSYNRDTGTINWQIKEWLRGEMTVGNNGTGYQSEQTNDTLTATDLNTGTYKWSYNFAILSGAGHGSHVVLIGNDGTIYTIRSTSGDDMLYAIHPDGRLKYTKLLKVGSAQVPTIMALSPDGNTLYFSYADSWWRSNLYALDLNNKADVKWIYEMGEPSALAVDSDGTIFVGSRYYTYGGVIIRSNITALNPDGTLKWKQNYTEAGDSDYASNAAFSLRDDGVLLVLKINSYDINESNTSIRAINKNDGSIIWDMDSYNFTLDLTDSNNYFYSRSTDIGATNQDLTNYLGYYNTAGVNKWKIVWPYNTIDGDYTADYGLGKPVFDDRGWIYGNFWKRRYTGVNYATKDSANSFAKTFALAPWTLSATKSVSTQAVGEDIVFTATTSMLQTNPLLGGTNQVQIYIDNGDKVPLTYDSTDVNGNTIWTGTYTIPESLTAGSHTYTVEAAQTYMQTDVTTHFASAPTQSNNTGRTASGTFNVLGDDQQQASDTVTVNSTQKQVAIVSDSATSISVPSSVTDASISVQPISTDNGTNVTATLPAIDISVTTSLSSNPITIAIPDDAVVTAPTGWNGIINVPQIQATSSITPPSIDNLSSTVLSVIEIGSNTTPLTFSKAVRILIPGQATSNNVKVSYIKDGISHEITTTCSADTQVAGDALPVGGDCKLRVGNDMVVWTKHFTKFVTYTNQTTSSAGSTGAPYVVPTTTTTIPTTTNQSLSDLMTILKQLITQYQQLKGSIPKEWEQFVSPVVSSIASLTKDLYLGISSNDVKILQQFLIDQNTGIKSSNLKQFGATGYFGNLTKEALIEYQTKHNIKPSSGYFGLITRNYIQGK